VLDGATPTLVLHNEQYAPHDARYQAVELAVVKEKGGAMDLHAVMDLLATGHARRGDDGFRGLSPDRGEQAHPADAHGQLVVLLLEAEGPGHAAAAGVELDDLGAWDLLQQLHGGAGAGEGLLVVPAGKTLTAWRIVQP